MAARVLAPHSRHHGVNDHHIAHIAALFSYGMATLGNHAVRSRHRTDRCHSLE